MAFTTPAKPLSRIKTWLTNKKNKRHYLKALAASVGSQKIAEFFCKTYPIEVSGTFKSLSEIKIPKELSPKQRKKFKKNKARELCALAERQMLTTIQFCKWLHRELIGVLYNPQKGCEVAKIFEKDARANEIEKVIHNLARLSEIKSGTMPIGKKQAKQFPEVDKAMNRITELVLLPKFEAELKQFKGRTETQNTE